MNGSDHQVHWYVFLYTRPYTIERASEQAKLSQCFQSWKSNFHKQVRRFPQRNWFWTAEVSVSVNICNEICSRIYLISSKYGIFLGSGSTKQSPRAHLVLRSNSPWRRRFHSTQSTTKCHNEFYKILQWVSRKNLIAMAHENTDPPLVIDKYASSQITAVSSVIGVIPVSRVRCVTVVGEGSLFQTSDNFGHSVIVRVRTRAGSVKIFLTD